MTKKIVTISAADFIEIGAATAKIFSLEEQLRIGLFMAELCYQLFDEKEEEND